MLRRHPVLMWAIPILLGVLWFRAATAAEESVARAACRRPAAASDEYYETYKVLIDTVDEVDRNYVKQIDRRELIEAAIKGVMSKLDPYSSYISPKELSGFRAAVDNEFGGIGIQILVDDGVLRILSPLYGTPAYRAGLLAGDWIVEIDGRSTEGLSQDEAIDRLKGSEGSRVTLLVVHAGRPAEERVKVTLRRERIRIDTVLGDHRKADDTWDFMLDAAIGHRLRAGGGVRPRDGPRLAPSLGANAGPAHAGADPRFAFQSRRPAQLGHRGEQSFHLQRTDRQHQGPQHARTGLERPQRRRLRGLSHGRAGQSLQRQRQRDRFGMSARPSAGGPHGRADLGQGERAERDRNGERPQPR